MPRPLLHLSAEAALASPSSGAPTEKTWTSEIAEEVFHALHPNCPAFPGQPNRCHPLVCDCGQSDNSGNPLAEQVRALVAERDGLLSFKRSVDEALNSGDGSYRP